MAKENSSNGNGSSVDVHLVRNGKGGVGKSVVATWMAGFLVTRGRSVRCIDGDPVNRSFKIIILPTCRNLRKGGGHRARVTPLVSPSTTCRRKNGVLADQHRTRVRLLPCEAGE